MEEKKGIFLKVFIAVENFGLKILEKIKLKFLADIYRSHLEGMRYLVFGALSTVVNILTYIICSLLIFVSLDESLRVNLSEIVAFITAVIFAYFTNKVCVFQSKTESKKGLLKEITSFLGCRLITEAISIGLMNLAVIINFNDVIMKVIANIVVIILNFVFSKLFIFKKKENKEVNLKDEKE